MKDKNTRKTIVIGIDGCDFEFLNKLLKTNRVPTIKKLIQEGAFGRLKSTIPPITGAAWTTFATGKSPQNHGCYDFLIPRDSLSGEWSVISTRDIQGKTFYELLNEEGYKVLIWNLPNSFPPLLKENHITITCSMLTFGNKFVFPEEIAKKYDFSGYETPDQILIEKGEYDKFVKNVLNSEEKRYNIFKKVFENEEWDFCFFLVSGTDCIQHSFYKGMFELKDTKALEIYSQVDKYLAEITSKHKDANIILMSDHGFCSSPRFYINKWLHDNGFLKTKEKDKFAEKQLFVKKKKQIEEFRKGQKSINIDNAFMRTILKIGPIARMAKFTYEKLFKKFFRIRFSQAIDISNSKCFSHVNSYGPSLYINDSVRFKDGIVSRQEYYKLIKEITSKLNKLNKKYNNQLFADIHTFDNLKEKQKRPDIIIEQKGFFFDKTLFSGTALQKEEAFYHGQYGIFVAKGPDIKKGLKLENLKLEDLAPTILHMYKVPVPEKLDGRAIKDMFREDSELNKEVHFRKTEEKSATEKEKSFILDSISDLKGI